MGNKQLPKAYLNRVLDYVKPSERRLSAVSVNKTELEAKAKCHSPLYTGRKIGYLSASELAVTLAQAAQILFDCLIIEPNFRYEEKINAATLAKKRRKHEIYFTHLDLRFHRRYPRRSYLLNLQVKHLRHHRGALFGQFIFTIGDYTSGTFLGSIPLNQT
jgi:hypothetical protein